MSKAQPAHWDSWSFVNEPPGAVDGDFSACCSASSRHTCPIDAFYENTGEVMKLGLPSQLTESHTLGRLLALGLVTGTEAYFRSIFLGMLEACPLTRERSADQMIALGALDYYGIKQVGLGVLEGVSFASNTEVKKRSNSLLGFTWQANSSVGIALENFDTVCHIRHASVHSQGQLSRGNARALGIMDSEGSSQVIVDFAHLQKIALICTALVRAYNSALFSSTVEKWISQKILTGSWSTDNRKFSALTKLFCSGQDGSGPKTANARYKQLLPRIAARASVSSA